MSTLPSLQTSPETLGRSELAALVARDIPRVPS